MRIGIINTNTSNIQSVFNALNYLGYSNYEEISSDKPNLKNDFTHIILPGNGSFKTNIDKIRENNLDNYLVECFNKNKYFLGICVGMQILATYGYENGKFEGLNIISGNVIKIPVKKKILPHIGWNDVIIKKSNPLIDKSMIKNSFYFLHSYYFDLIENESLLCSTYYEKEFPVIIKKKNFYGVQFHPEKSQTDGINLVKNFLSLK